MDQGTVPEMLISVTPGLKFCFLFCILGFHSREKAEIKMGTF